VFSDLSLLPCAIYVPCATSVTADFDLSWLRCTYSRRGQTSSFRNTIGHNRREGSSLARGEGLGRVTISCLMSGLAGSMEDEYILAEIYTS
jgi:hypothetical protein